MTIRPSAAVAAAPGTPGIGAGIALFSVGILFFAVNDALGKWLVADYGVGQILLLRTAGATLVLLPMLWRHRAALRVPDQRGLHALRAVLMVGDTFAFYSATKVLPLADVMTFYLAAPLIITALAAVFLRERVGRERWMAVLVGFVGVAVALRPSGAVLSAPGVLALGGATLFAASVTITRQLRRTHWLTLIAVQMAGAGLAGALLAPLDWHDPGTRDLALMFLVGIVSMACFVCITRALALAPASVLAPLHYASIVWAALLGWAIWGDVPAPHVVLGAAVIIGAGALVIHAERRREREAR